MAHTECNMRVFDSCWHTTERKFSNLPLRRFLFYLPRTRRMCSSANELLFSRIIGGHTDDLFPHISLNEDRQKFGHSLSPHLATWTETGFRSTDSRHPTRTDLNVLIYFLSSSVWPQNKLKTRSIHMVIRIRRRNKKRSLSGTTIEEVN